MALSIFELAQFDDRSRRAVSCRIDMGQPDMMCAAVDTIDHGVGGTLEFIIETAIDEPPYDRIIKAFPGQDVA